MILIAYRAAGVRFDIDAFLAAHPDVRPARVWHAGEQQGATVLATSGCTLGIPDIDDSSKLPAVIGAFLHDSARWLAFMRNHDVKQVIDIGICISDSKSPFPSVALPAATLESLAAYRIDLVVSCYP